MAISVNKLAVTSQLLDLASKVIRLKAGQEASVVRRAVCEGIHIKQVGSFVESMENDLIPFFEKQIISAAGRLKDIGGVKGGPVIDRATQIANQIFVPNEWNLDLVRNVIPAWVRMAGEAMLSQELIMQVDSKVGIDVSKLNSLLETKESTASDFVIDEFGRENIRLVDLIPFSFASQLGNVDLYLSTEFPLWMKNEIQKLLSETFNQPYWLEVNKTTLADIEEYLRKGIVDGLSIEQMATNMIPSLIEEGKYALIRGRMIARTESTHVLNGARSVSIDKFIRDTGFQSSIKKIWMSVLGDTTRADHADLDGVPVDKDGLWFLGGVRVRWPGDINLSAAQRINCLCTVLAEFGLNDTDADQLRADHQERLLQLAV